MTAHDTDAPNSGTASVAGPLGEAVAEALAAEDFSGVALAIGPDGLLAEVAMGLADRANGRPNTPSTRFGTASVGKVFTAVAVVRLADRGLVRLDAPVVDLLPAERRPSTLDPGVTLEHLLSHTSGLTDYVDEAGGEAYEDLWVTWNPAVMRSPADLLPIFADRPPRARPGEEVRYCNAAFVLAGLVLEAVTGRAYVDVIADEVLGPAGMTATGYPALDDVVPDLALGHLRPEHDGDPWRTNLYMIPARGMPDGGAYTTAGDLVRFSDAFLAGHLVGEAARDDMLRSRAWDADEETHYGLAFWRTGSGPREWVGHPGGDPGFAAFTGWYPASGIRFAIVGNVTPGVGAARRAFEAVLVPA